MKDVHITLGDIFTDPNSNDYYHVGVMISSSECVK